MKKIIFFLLVAIISCKKDVANNSIDNLFTETKENIEINEPVLLSFGDNAAAKSYSWKVEPSNYTIEEMGAYATFKFLNNGNYKVTCTSNKKQGTFMVNVLNKKYNEIGNSFSLTSSKLFGIKTTEEVEFTANNTSSVLTQFNWNIKYGLIGAIYNNQKANIDFKSEGVKFITVKDGTKEDTRTVLVEDGILIDSKYVPFIFGDKININTSIQNNKIVFNATTTFKYKCNNDKIINGSTFYNINNTFYLSFLGVKVNNTACNNNNMPTCTNSLDMVTNGSYSLVINYENKTFNGKLNINNGEVKVDFINNNFINFTN